MAEHPEQTDRPADPDRPGRHASGSTAAGRAANNGTSSGTTAGSTPGRAPLPDDPAAIEAEIARTREQLGETVEALSAKLDVRTRTKDAVDHALHDHRGQVRPAVPAVGFAAVLLVVGLVLLRRRKD